MIASTAMVEGMPRVTAECADSAVQGVGYGLLGGGEPRAAVPAFFPSVPTFSYGVPTFKLQGRGAHRLGYNVL